MKQIQIIFLLLFSLALSVSAITYTSAPTGEQTDDFTVITASSDVSGDHYMLIDFNKTLVGWYTFDARNSSNDPGDLSTYGYNGSKVNNAINTSSGIFGDGFEFDGTNDYVELNKNPSQNFSGGLDNFTFNLSASDGDQGMVYDGTHFYWAENNGLGQNSTIYKINSSGDTVTSFNGPVHGAAGDYKQDTQTLLFAGNDASSDYELWELYPGNGSLKLTWNLSGIEENTGGATVAWVDNYTVIYRTGVASGRFNYSLLNLYPDGNFTVLDSWTIVDNFGPGQGNDYLDGHLYVIGDWPTSSDTHKWLVKFKLETGKEEPTVIRVWHYEHGDELEGLSFDPEGETLYFGDINNQLYKSNWPSWEQKGFSVSLWFNRDGFTDANAFLAGQGSNNDSVNPWAIFMNSGDTDAIRFRVRNLEGDQDFLVQNVAQNDQWNHIVATYDGLWQRFYHNGTQVAANATVGQLLDRNSSPTIGCDKNSGSPANCFDGTIDEVLFYSRSLFPDEIEALYNGSSYSHNFTALGLGTYEYETATVNSSGTVTQSALLDFRVVSSLTQSTSSSTTTATTTNAYKSKMPVASSNGIYATLASKRISKLLYKGSTDQLWVGTELTLESVQNDSFIFSLDGKEYTLDKTNPTLIDLDGDGIVDVQIEYYKEARKGLHRVKVTGMYGRDEAVLVE